jgi:RNase P subunit RPR2
MVYPSRKPEPYIQAICKECSNSLEFLPKLGIKNTKVEVECWSCNKISSFEIDASGTKIKASANRSTPKWSRKRGSGKGNEARNMYSISFK